MYGPTHHVVGATQLSEVNHLTRLFRTSTPDRSDITALLRFVRRDTTDSFTEVQQQSLIEAASVRLSTSVDCDGAMPVHGDMHGGQTCQTHLFTFNYYTDDQWSFFGGVAVFKRKFNMMSKAWLHWGLRFPSGPTYRRGLATILVASDLTATTTHAHLLFVEFTTEFKMLRDLIPGETNLKIFPSHASAFATLYPNLMKEVVDCRVDANLILEAATKELIPIKASNKQLPRKPSPTNASPSADSTPREQLMQGLSEMVVGRREPSVSPTVDRSPQAQSEGVNRPQTQPIQQPTLLALEGVSHDDEVSIVDKGDSHVVPSTVTDVKADPAQGRRARLDGMDCLVDGYLAAKLEINKKPAGATRGANKAVGIVAEGSQEEEGNSDEEEDSIVAEAPGKAKMKAEAKTKAAGKTKAAAKKAAAKTVATEAPPATITRPAAVDETSSSKFPRVDRTETVYFGGGRLHKAAGNMVRVYARTGDRGDKRCTFTDTASLNVAWEKACHVIANDPRPRLSSNIARQLSVDRHCTFFPQCIGRSTVHHFHRVYSTMAIQRAI